MAKYYCATGQFKTIVVANDVDNAVDLAVERLIEQGEESGLVMSISETGYDLYKCQFVSMIPLLKKAGIDLPLSCDLIDNACNLLGKNPDDLNKYLKDWLTGDAN